MGADSFNPSLSSSSSRTSAPYELGDPDFFAEDFYPDLLGLLMSLSQDERRLWASLSESTHFQIAELIFNRKEESLPPHRINGERMTISNLFRRFLGKGNVTSEASSLDLGPASSLEGAHDLSPKTLQGEFIHLLHVALGMETPNTPSEAGLRNCH